MNKALEELREVLALPLPYGGGESQERTNMYRKFEEKAGDWIEAHGESVAKDAARYQHRRFIEVTNALSYSGVMAMSPELFQSALDDYDKQTDELKVIQIDFD